MPFDREQCVMVMHIAHIHLINLIYFFQLQDCQRDVGETDLLHRGE